VTEVHNNLEVVLPPDSVRDDAMLTTAANNALAADATVPEGVEATARNGNLTLTGTVQYLSQRAAVEKVVSGLIGVRQVRNEINVVCGVEPADVKQLVRGALDRSALVPDDSDVRIDTSGSTVILTGHVRTGTERDAVVGAAWMARGVAIVVDELEVTG
jgi:osmotically-inducible protein OsmY